MHTPKPDTGSRPPTAPPPDPSGEALPSAKPSGSIRLPAVSTTGSSLSDLLRANAGIPTRRSSAAADLAAQLMQANGNPPPKPSENTDDAPTIITQNRATAPLNPPPPYVVGETPSLAGRQLGHYELIEAIGAGGMAAVLKARDMELGRIVALKILPPESALDQENVSRFKQEARAAAKLDHENVARVYYCGEDQGLHFIAFEFVDGMNLRALIDRRGQVPAGECVGYMIQIAAGLAHACERGVVHRDIKPSNIIITPQGRAKIVDMGLARLDANPVNGGMTQSGITLGTFDYISPEQALDPRRADVRSDLYSLGCTFYHALTGRPPVPEGTAAKKLHAHQHIPPLDPRELNPGIPDVLAIVLARMMMKDPERRYQTPGELIADLKRLIDPAQASSNFMLADSVVRAIPASDSVLPPPPRVPVAALLIGAAVLLVVAALALTSSEGPTAAPSWATTAVRKTLPGPIENLAPPKTRPTTETANAATLEDLIEKSRSGATHLRIRLTGRQYDLTPSDFAFEGKAGRTLILEGASGTGAPVEIRVAAVPMENMPDRRGSMSFLGFDSVKVQGVRFVVVKSPDEDDGTLPLVGLAARDVGTVSLADCQFDSPAEERTVGNVAAVGLSHAAEKAAGTLGLERCLFLPGAVGVRVAPGTVLNVDDSGFAPQTMAAIQVRAEEEHAGRVTDAARVTLSRSSFLIEPRSAVVQTDGQSPAAVTAGYCVFAPTGPTADLSRPEEGRAAHGRGVVVRVDGEQPDGVRFDGDDGKRNVYYRVDPLGLKSGETAKVYSFDECKRQKWPFSDSGAVPLKRLPWATADLSVQWEKPADPHKAFRLRDDAEVFVSSDKAVKFVGVRFAVPGKPEWGLTYENQPLVRTVVAALIKEKVWWHEPPEGEILEPGVYNTLDKLLLDLRNGDTILIRHDGLLPTKPVAIAHRNAEDEKAGEFTVTIKPYRDKKNRLSRPVLTTGPTKRLDVALFTLEEGDVTFENLEFRIAAGAQGGAVGRQAVSLFGAKRCSFQSCVFTLEEDGGKSSAVVVADPDGRMMAPAAARSAPHLRFEDCLIRGRGAWLGVPASRAFEMEATNCVAALDGTLLTIDPSGRNPGDAHSRLHLKRVTALLGGPVIDLQAGKNVDGGGTGLVPTHVEAEDCVFAAVPNANRPLIEVEGLDVDGLKDVLTWTRPANSGRANWYANFDAAAVVVDFTLPADGMPAKKWLWNDWLHFGDRPVGTPLGKVTFAAGPAGPRELAAVKPEDVRVKAIDFPEMAGVRIGDAGANPDSLPRPAE